MITPIKRFDGKIVGNISGDSFYTHRYPELHFYVMGQGYPIGDDILQILKNRKVKIICIIEHRKDGTIKFYRTPIETYLDAPMIQHEPFEQQRCVSLTELETGDY